MPATQDGPRSPLFEPLPFEGNVRLSELAQVGVSDELSAALEHAPSGACIGWGIPFAVGDVVVLADQAVTVRLDPTTSPWLVFMHTSHLRPLKPNFSGFFSPMRREGHLGEHAANYALLYADGTEAQVRIRRRHQIGTFQRRWGENCLEAVAHRKPRPMRAAHEQLATGWGFIQMRASAADSGPWINWLWAWENPNPDKTIVGARLEPTTGIRLRQTTRSMTSDVTELHWIRRRCDYGYRNSRQGCHSRHGLHQVRRTVGGGLRRADG